MKSIFSASRGSLVFLLALAGCDRTAAANKPVEATGSLDVRVDDKGFTPSSITTKKGAPLVLKLTRTTDATCAKDIVFPELNLKKPLPLNQVVEVDVPTDTARTLKFTCGMGMFDSAVVIR